MAQQVRGMADVVRQLLLEEALQEGFKEVPMNLAQLQTEHRTWHDKNFPVPAEGAGWAENSLIGAFEELGELAHANLKRRQGIRGTEAEHTAAERDAIGDVIIYLTGYCSARGFSLAECVERAWMEVKDRDWVKNKGDGVNA